MSFTTVDQLNTLAEAREAFASLLATHEAVISEKDGIAASFEKARAESEALREDLVAANEMLDEVAREKMALSTSVEELTAQVAQAQASLDGKSGELAQALEQVAQLKGRVGQLETEAKTAEAKAAQICASVGVEPALVTPGGEPKQQSLLEQMRSITNPAQQMAFFRKHRDAILRGQ